IRGRWARPPMPGYVWCDPYYEARDGVVVIVEPHWSRPGVVFVPPPPVRVRVIPPRPGYVVVPPPRGVHGRILPPPPGGRVGVVVPAPSPVPRVVAPPPAGRPAIVPPPPYRPGGAPTTVAVRPGAPVAAPPPRVAPVGGVG